MAKKLILNYLKAFMILHKLNMQARFLNLGMKLVWGSEKVCDTENHAVLTFQIKEKRTV